MNILISMELKDLRTGDVLLYRDRKFLSKAIQWFEKCKWSHTSLVINIWDTNFTEEAEIEGLVINKIEDSIKGNEILLLRPKFNYDSIELSKQVISMAGKHRYNFFKLIIVQIIWQVFHIWVGKVDTNDKLRRVICGEFVAYVYHILSKDILFKDWYEATPKSLFESDLFEHYNLTN